MKDLVSNEYLAKKYPMRGSFEVQGKTVNIPAIYRGKGLTAVFPISYKKAVEAIHSKDLKPARLSLTKALLSITAFDFYESPVGPYTELAYAIPVLYKPKLNIPLLPLLFNKSWKGLGYYVVDLLQSTEIAVAHGKILSGYPHNDKLTDTRFYSQGQKVCVDVTQGKEKVLSMLSVKSRPTKNVFKSYVTYFEQDERLFSIIMDIYGEEGEVKGCTLGVGKNQSSDLLRKLEISTESLQTYYYPDFFEILPVVKRQL